MCNIYIYEHVLCNLYSPDCLGIDDMAAVVKTSPPPSIVLVVAVAAAAVVVTGLGSEDGDEDALGLALGGHCSCLDEGNTGVACSEIILSAVSSGYRMA
jgi:hypothetical protein